MMTDSEVRQQVERADCFIEQLRDAIAATVVDPASPCADDHGRGLQRIADTLDAVPYVTMCNIANLNTAMRGGLRAASDVRWCWPDIGLRGRDGVPRWVRDHDREGAKAAAAMRG